MDVTLTKKPFCGETIPDKFKVRRVKKLFKKFITSFDRKIENVDLDCKIEDIDFASGLSSGGHILYGLARTMRPQVCVEIGSARGLSACYVGRALLENNQGMLYAIDPHSTTNWNDSDSVDTYNIMTKNLARYGVASRVEIVRDYSTIVAKSWTTSIDLLFIDGDHSYEGVKNDWELYSKFVTAFGVVVFHDTTWEYHRDSTWYRKDMGVPRFVDELRSSGFPVVSIDQYCGISLVQPRINGVSLMNVNAVQ
jgi:predicted O-methyltransferase YrrM